MTAALPAIHAVDLAVRVRDAVGSDMAYVVSTWRATWHGASQNRRLNSYEFGARFDRLVIAGVLADPGTRVIVGCDEADPDAIIAWACYSPGVPTLHWSYTREAHPATGEYMRGRGLFAVLMTAIGVREGGGVAYTCRPQEFWRAKAPGSRWKPLGKVGHPVEPRLLEAARLRRVAISYTPLDQFLGRR